MKKYSFLPILALVLGIAASAFTSIEKAFKPSHSKNVTEAYFYLPSASVGDENDPSKWSFDDEDSPTATCFGDDVLCTVKAPATEVNGQIVIDENQLASPIDMRSDPAVTNRQYQGSH